MRTLLCSVLLSLLTACSTPGAAPAAEAGDGGPDAGDGGGPTVTTACQQLATARCDRLEACEPGTLNLRYGDVATCVTRQALDCASALNAPGTGNTAQHSVDCAQAVQALSCPDTLVGVVPAPCATVAGALDAGSGCAFRAQCQSDYCNVATDAVCGTCAATPTDGQPCPDSGCGSGLTCAGDNTCRTPIITVGTNCDQTHPCGASLVCVRVRSGGMMTATCQPSASVVGANCSPTNQAAPNCDRKLGLVCSPSSHTCVAATFATAGEPCGALDGGVAGCSAGGDCQLEPQTLRGHCVAAVADGAACGADAGPCLLPAVCVAGVCTVADATKCP